MKHKELPSPIGELASWLSNAEWSALELFEHK